MIIHMDKLTNEQQKFASDNHYLVENFLKFRRLNRDEYYDIAAIGYMRAVGNYFRRSDLRIYRFSTIANYSMKSDLYNYYRKLYRQKRKAEIVSLDGPAYDGDNLTMAEVIAAPGVFTDDVETEMTLDDIVSDMPDKCAKILRMRYDGYNNREIAKSQGISVKDIDVIIKQIQDKINGMRLVQTVNQ